MSEQNFSLPVVTSEAADASVSRRALLGAAFAVGTGMLLGACSNERPVPETSTTAAPAPESPSAAAPTSTAERDLTGSNDEQLQLLGDREKSLGREFADLMVFLPMPTDEASAADRASEAAGRLKEFAKQGVKPYLVIEPNDANEKLLDLHKLPTGPFQTFLTGLKEKGVTSEEMGTVVVCPEANMPNWKNNEVDPDLFKRNVSHLGGELKKTFPDAKLGVLLNSTSYDKNWTGSKRAADIAKYVQGLDGVDELCFQGFPWSNDTTDPRKFLNADVAMEVAALMGGPKKIALRFNTGSYSTQINPDTQANAKMDLGQRTEVLKGILIEAEKTAGQGYDTTLQIFGENKAEEEADWSYGQSPEATTVLKQFFDAADKAGIHTAICG